MLPGRHRPRQEAKRPPSPTRGAAQCSPAAPTQLLAAPLEQDPWQSSAVTILCPSYSSSSAVVSLLQSVRGLKASLSTLSSSLAPSRSRSGIVAVDLARRCPCCCCACLSAPRDARASWKYCSTVPTVARKKSKTDLDGRVLPMNSIGGCIENLCLGSARLLLPECLQETK